ncbi:MAG: family 20 glycosylhydrolase [Ferruginibacter sp.]
MKRTKPCGFWQLIISATIYCSLFLCPGVMTAGPLIFPIPQYIKLTDEAFILDEFVSIILPENAGKNDIFLANFLVRELSDKYGVALKIERLTGIPKNRKVVVIGTIKNSLVKKYCLENNLELSAKNPGTEGYLLQVSSNLIFIGGSDDPGAFFGLQSLCQLMEAGKGLKIQGVKVKDWPAFPFRAIKVYIPGPANMAFFKRFLRDFVARYKFNKVMIEFNCMRLDKHPEVNAGWIEFAKYMQYTRSNETLGMKGEIKNSTHYDAGDGFIIEKNDVKEIVDFASQNFIEVIPEIPSLTHAYSLLTRHPELAEYPGDRWPDTYCPSNPASYKLMFDVYDEYIEVIHPKMIHIGHDEWWGAPLDVCPRCKGKDYSELYAQDINKIHGYLAAKGIKAAIWGDFLLESVRGEGPIERTSSTGKKYKTPGGLRPSVVRKSIPKDILIFNWFYTDEKKELELKRFGFKQVYGNFEPNISNWDERIKKIDLVGGAPSSWASTNEFNFGKDLISDFLGCANLLWSSHTINQADLPSIVWALVPSIRRSFKAERVPSEDGDAVVPIDISSHFNLSPGSKGFNINLTRLRSGKVNNRAKIFELVNSAKATGKCGIIVGSEGIGENNFPNKAEAISINEDVSSLIFLHASALPAGNQKAYFNIPNNFDASDMLGWYDIVYEDGFREIVPIQYGVNILEWNPGGEKSLNNTEGETGSVQKTYSYEADAVNCSSDEKDNPISFFAFEWVNKRFGKKIKEVNLYGSVHYQALQQDYAMPVTEPAPSNAIMLIGLSKVVKRMAATVQ